MGEETGVGFLPGELAVVFAMIVFCQIRITPVLTFHLDVSRAGLSCLTDACVVLDSCIII